MVRPGGLEPSASWFEAMRSIQLSYGRTSHVSKTGDLTVQFCVHSLTVGFTYASVVYSNFTVISSRFENMAF